MRCIQQLLQYNVIERTTPCIKMCIFSMSLQSLCLCFHTGQTKTTGMHLHPGMQAHTHAHAHTHIAQVHKCCSARMHSIPLQCKFKGISITNLFFTTGFRVSCCHYSTGGSLTSKIIVPTAWIFCIIANTRALVPTESLQIIITNEWIH